VGHNRSTPA